MKIALIGNQDNGGYRLCKWMRACGFDARLYLFASDHHERSLPESIDRDIAAGGYPEWIRRYDQSTKLWFLRPNESTREIERHHDVAVTMGRSGLITAGVLQNIPTVHMALGHEVTELPMLLWNRSARLVDRPLSLLARRALARVDAIVNDYQPTMRTIAQLGLLGKVLLWSWPEDVRGNLGRVDQRLLANLNDRYRNCHRVAVWLGRLNFLDPASPAYKGPEKFLASFKRLVQDDGGNWRAVIGSHGFDAEAFRQLVKEQGLEGYVDYVPHMPYWKLLTYLSLENGVVFDEIGPRYLSGIAREALSVGAVIAKTVDEDLLRLNYGGQCPVLPLSDDPETCYQAMVQLDRLDQTEFDALKSDCLRWAGEHLHYERVVPRLERILSEVVYRSAFSSSAARTKAA